MRELSGLALRLIGLQLNERDQNAVERQCSSALARAAEIQQSSEHGATGDMPGHLARLCALLTGDGPADGLPRGWSSMIEAAGRTDGTQQHLDLRVALPAVDDFVVRVDSLVSEPGSWRVYLQAARAPALAAGSSDWVVYPARDGDYPADEAYFLRSILSTALVVGLFGWWPVPVGHQGGYDPKAELLPRGLLLLAPNRGNKGAIEFTWRGLELIVGNYYVLILLVFIAATACALVLARRLGPEHAQSASEPDVMWAARPPGVAR